MHYSVKMDKSYLLIADGRAYTASRGYIELCRVLGGQWHVLRIIAAMPERQRDWFYTLIARNRYRWFGKADYCTQLIPEQRNRVL